jgi:hypothetical protein
MLSELKISKQRRMPVAENRHIVNPRPQSACHIRLCYLRSVGICMFTFGPSIEASSMMSDLSGLHQHRQVHHDASIQA